MVCDPNDDTDPINSFSLVSYIPGRLGDFLDRLRQELVPDCIAYAHVTILPPRPLLVQPRIADEEIRSKAAEFPPFSIEIPRIRIFDETNVVFADIGQGRAELLELHDALSRGSLAFDEPYSYHPHTTLAQNISAEEVPEVFEIACRRWHESAPASGFLVETLTFVQNTVGNRWLDLSECELRGSAAVHS